MRIRILAFAHLRELLEQAELDVELPPGATAADAWNELSRRRPGIDPLRNSTRFARNGVIVAAPEPLSDGDELALLPPAGGG